MSRYNIYHPEDVCGRLPGVVRQIGTHHAYTVLYLLGDDAPTLVSAFRSTLRDETTGIADDRENLAVITFTTKSGAIVHLQLNFASDDHSSDAWSFYVKVIGSRGATRYSYNDWVQNARTMVHSHTYEPYPHTITATDEHFVERVIQRGEQPLSTLDHAITAQKLLDAAEQSWTERRHITIE
jgi:predicted dehydrogenase